MQEFIYIGKEIACSFLLIPLAIAITYTSLYGIGHMPTQHKVLFCRAHSTCKKARSKIDRKAIYAHCIIAGLFSSWTGSIPSIPKIRYGRKTVDTNMQSMLGRGRNTSSLIMPLRSFHKQSASNTGQWEDDTRKIEGGTSLLKKQISCRAIETLEGTIMGLKGLQYEDIIHLWEEIIIGR